jgi:hypothetical protein
MLTSFYTSTNGVQRTEQRIQTTGMAKIPPGVCAILIQKYCDGHADITTRAGNFRVAGPDKQGWGVIRVEEGDVVMGFTAFYYFYTN